MLILNAPCSHSSIYNTALRLLLACSFSLWVKLEVEAPTYLDFDCSLFSLLIGRMLASFMDRRLLCLMRMLMLAYDVHALRSSLLHTRTRTRTRTRSNTKQIVLCDKSFLPSDVKLFANAREPVHTPSPCNAPTTSS